MFSSTFNCYNIEGYKVKCVTAEQVKKSDKQWKLYNLNQMFMNLREFISFCLTKLFQNILNILFNIVLNTVMKTKRDELYFVKFDVCVTVHHWYNIINSQLEAIIINACWRLVVIRQHTTSCKHKLVLQRMGEIIAPNMLSWL